MSINILKSDNTLEKLDLAKILRWGNWAAENCPNVSLESVVNSASSSFYDGMSTDEITIALCKSCEDFSAISSEQKDFDLVRQYFEISRNLYIPNVIKKANKFHSKHLTASDIYSYGFDIADRNKVPLSRYKTKSVLNLGISLNMYDSNLLDGTLPDELFDFVDEMLDYSLMNKLYFNGLRQIEEKYLTKLGKQIIEDPQQHFALIALALVHSDSKIYSDGMSLNFQKESFINYYRIQSQAKANNPTPFSAGIRTPHKQYDSCCLYSIGDDNNSIDVGMMTAQKATVAGAGVGVSLGRIRAKGKLFRKSGVHAGLLGYLGQLTKTIKGSNQVSRGGSATVNLPIWHRDYYELVMLKDVTSGIEGENRYRHLDYCFHFSDFILSKLRTNEKVLLVSPNELLPSGKTAYEAFYNVDENGKYDDTEYREWEAQLLSDPHLPYLTKDNTQTAVSGAPVYTTAYDMFSTLLSQMMSTGRLYTLNVTNTNDHSCFLDVVEMTNLCVEITQPTSPVYLEYNSKDHEFNPSNESETSFCQLGGIVFGNTKYEEIEDVCYWICRFQEAVFNITEYSKIPFSQKQKQRRNIGIGFVNTQQLLVEEVYSKFPEKEWIKETAKTMHKYVEAVQYYLLKASNRLAQELSPCEMFDRTKYSKGILPIDTCKNTELNSHPLLKDWEILRANIKQYGLRFGAHTASMPVESSSVTFSLINGNEFPRAPVTFKGNKKLLTAVAVPNIAEYGDKYVYAWDNRKIDKNALYLAMCSNINKFIDQSISYNFYFDLTKGKLDELELLYTIFVALSKEGIKTTYYLNFNTDAQEEEEEKTEEMTEEEKQFFEQLKLLEQETGCAGGSCTL